MEYYSGVYILHGIPCLSLGVGEKKWKSLSKESSSLLPDPRRVIREWQVSQIKSLLCITLSVEAEMEKNSFFLKQTSLFFFGLNQVFGFLISKL